MEFKHYQNELSIQCKNGINFIAAAAITWLIITFLWLSDLTLVQKAYLMFFAGGILFPLSFLISKIFKIKWSVENNPLSPLGLYTSMGQILYFPLVIWSYVYAPENFVLFYAVVTAAHLLPFAFLYRCKAYQFMSISMVIIISILGFSLKEEYIWVQALTMTGLFVVLSILLLLDYRSKLK